jgi:hypothetical protein
LDNTLSVVTQLSIENFAMLPSEHPSTEPTCSINWQRVIKPPKTRADDFLWTCLPVGATALGEPWTPLQPVSTVRFLSLSLDSTF